MKKVDDFGQINKDDDLTLSARSTVKDKLINKIPVWKWKRCSTIVYHRF
jgi:hypothetical protein